MEGLALEEAIKALEEGKTLQYYKNGEWLDSILEKGNEGLLMRNFKNFFHPYRIKPTEEKEVVLQGLRYLCSDNEYEWLFEEEDQETLVEKGEATHKITFKVNENNEPTGEIRIERV